MSHRPHYEQPPYHLLIPLTCVAGAFPLWLAPVQVRFLMVTDAALPYVEGLAQQFREAGVRVEIMTGGRDGGQRWGTDWPAQ